MVVCNSILAFCETGGLSSVYAAYHLMAAGISSRLLNWISERKWMAGWMELVLTSNPIKPLDIPCYSTI